ALAIWRVFPNDDSQITVALISASFVLLQAEQGRRRGASVEAPIPGQRAHGPVETRWRARASAVRTTSAGTPYPPVSPMRAANIVDWTTPRASTAGPPESPCWIFPRKLVISRDTGPRPYASSVVIRAVSPIRPASTSRAPFPG